MKKRRSQIAIVCAVTLGAPFMAHAGFFDSLLNSFNDTVSSFFGSNTDSKPIATSTLPQQQKTSTLSQSQTTPIQQQQAQKSLTIVKVSGDTTAVTGSTPKTPFIFKVLDENNKPVANVPLSFVTADKFSQVFLKSAKTDANGLVEATWVAGRQPSDTINVSASLNDRSGKLTLNTTTTEVKRPWGMSNTYMHFKRPGTIKLDNVKGYKVTVVPGTEALGTYYEVMGFPGSYAGLQVSATGEKRVLHSTWDIDELGEAGKAKTTDKGDTTCKTFGNEGTGASCSMPLSWQTGRAYEFAMTYKNGTNEDGSEYTDSTMTLTDVDANKTYNLGTHRYAKKISVDQIYLFVEDFKRDTANCWDMPKRKLSVTDAQIQQTDGTWTSINNAEISLYNGKKDFECHNVNGGVEKDSNDKNRWFMASADEVVSNPYRNLKSVKLN